VAATLAIVACGPAHAQSCTFFGSAPTIGFGALDPSLASTRTAFGNVTLFCIPLAATPTSWQFGGANGNAPLRMKHASQAAYIPYSVTRSFVSTNGFVQTWRLTATVLGSDYVNAPAGAYSDILTATINP